MLGDPASHGLPSAWYLGLPLLVLGESVSRPSPDPAVSGLGRAHIIPACCPLRGLPRTHSGPCLIVEPAFQLPAALSWGRDRAVPGAGGAATSRAFARSHPSSSFSFPSLFVFHGLNQRCPSLVSSCPVAKVTRPSPLTGLGKGLWCTCIHIAWAHMHVCAMPGTHVCVHKA